MNPASPIIAMSVFTALAACADSQNEDRHYRLCSNEAESSLNSQLVTAHVSGEIVADIGPSCWVIFQDKDNNYWFGTDGLGVCRYDGKVLTRFTTQDGLAHDQVRGIQQHGPTGHILISTNGGVSRFDGHTFVTLPKTDMPSSGSLEEMGWVLDTDDVWIQGNTGPMGPLRYDGDTLYALHFPQSPQADEWFATYPNVPTRPYDVWTVYKDHRGHVWLGTACFGVCRFDGTTREWLYEAHHTEIGNAHFGLRSMIQDKAGAFWFCNTRYRYHMTPASSSSSDAGVATKRGEIAYAREQGVDPAQLPPGESPIYFQGVVVDQAGDLWMATYGYGVWRYDGKNMTHYWIRDSDPPHDVITLISIHKDNHGGLWLSTHEHGAYRSVGTTFERFRP